MQQLCLQLETGSPEMKTKLSRKDVQTRFDDINKLLDKELTWSPHPICHGKFEVTPHDVWQAAYQLLRLKKDVLKDLDYLHGRQPALFSYSYYEEV
jgi:hypothetical protein